MAAYKIMLTLVVMSALAAAQRPFYAGLRPIGYPETAANNLLANRFGEDSNLPIEARGNGNLVNTFQRLPVDKQPFWYINSDKYDALRKNPQTFEARPNSFIN